MPRQGYERPSYYWREYQQAERAADGNRRGLLIRDYYRSQGKEEDDPDDPLVREFTENQLRYELLIGVGEAVAGKRYLKTEFGNLAFNGSKAQRPMESQALFEAGQGELTVEALVIKHANRFPLETAARAAERIIRYADRIPEEIAGGARDLLARRRGQV